VGCWLSGGFVDGVVISAVVIQVGVTNDFVDAVVIQVGVTVPGDNSIDVLTNDVAVVVMTNADGEVEVS
jgi:hypothetical protein